MTWPQLVVAVIAYPHRVIDAIVWQWNVLSTVLLNKHASAIAAMVLSVDKCERCTTFHACIRVYPLRRSRGVNERRVDVLTRI